MNSLSGSIADARATRLQSNVQCLLDVALLLAILLVAATWFFDPLLVQWGPLDFDVGFGPKCISLAILLLVARLLWRRHVRRRAPDFGGPAETPVYRKIVLATLAGLFAFMAMEGLAWLAGGKKNAFAPIVIYGNEANDTKSEGGVLRDPELLFAFVPNRKWDGYWINKYGFRTWEFTPEKPENTVRLICLGDSCTAQGRPPYSDILNERLKTNAPTALNWESFNMGVFGYSLMQGYRQFMRDGRPLKPDIVTIYFGWNDHWLKDRPDHLRMAVRMNRARAMLTDAIQKKRTYALLVEKFKKPLESPQGPDHLGVRVPPDIYAATLSNLIYEVRQIGAIPIVLTAPSRGLHTDSEKRMSVRTVAEGNQLHQQYLGITREVAALNNADLLDMAAVLADPQYDGIFLKDGIHFKQRGLEIIADLLEQRLHEMAEDGRFDNLQ
jgi:lysophospholipase L1-like esterase